MWELWLLAVLVGFGFGVAIIMALWKHGEKSMAIRSRPNRQVPKTVTLAPPSAQKPIDTNALANAVAEIVTKNLLDKLTSFQYSESNKVTTDDVKIFIDESIIPITIEATADFINTENLGSQETCTDNSLADSKTKLANLLKKKEGK